jgi:type II restriction enzyme
MTNQESLRTLVDRWRQDEGASYRSWFLWDQRLKNFRTIRAGLAVVVQEITAGTFGNQYRGSSLEVVVQSVAEQRQIFKGADHAFLWKPKLRIPDIYENPENQRAFARFLHTCACCNEEDTVLRAIRELDAKAIKGLGPASANLLYFLHPTIAAPFNTAIVKGYNALTGSKVKLGRWSEYLAMREGIVRLNTAARDLLSNDLGAIGGLLFDLGKGRYPAPPLVDTKRAHEAWESDLARVRAEDARERNQREAAANADVTHTHMQGWLRDLGRALGFDVWIAANDKSREYEGRPLAEGCLDELPEPVRSSAAAEVVRLIDVIWFEPGGPARAAFEVEHTTSIHSGIVRLLDLALGVSGSGVSALFIVAPDDREEEVRAQLRRPAFARVADLRVRYLPYGELAKHRASISRFGQGLRPIELLARELT